MTSPKKWKILLTGGAGYVGSSLVPKLITADHEVTVLDLYLYGDDVLESSRESGMLREIKGDMRDPVVVADAIKDCNAVIHLACISNDPSYDLDPDLGKSINFDCILPLVRAAKDAGVERFIYASSSSVYGIKDDAEVTEELTLEPLTDYSKYKALCEDILLKEATPDFTTCIIRPSTVCGYARRQRMDVVVNILTNHAVHNGVVRVLGGSQKRPNIHIDDMTNLYLFLLNQQSSKINGKIYNAGYENHTVMQLAEMVQAAVSSEMQRDVSIRTEETDDLRSYHVSSAKIERELGFAAKHTIEDAARDLVTAINDGRLTDSMNNPLYFNIKTMQSVGLK